MIHNEARLKELTARTVELDSRCSQIAEYVTILARNQEELHAGLLRTGGGVARLEKYAFALIRVLLQNETIQHHDLTLAIEELAGATDLEVYWGVKEAAVEEPVEPPAEPESAADLPSVADEPAE